VGPLHGNDVATSFPFDFKVISPSEVLVQKVAGGVTTAADPSEYSVSVYSEGGDVAFSTPPATGTDIYIYSDPNFLQQIAFQNQTRFSPAQIGEAMDRAAVRDLVLKEGLDRAVRAPRGEPVPTLPPLASRTGLAAWQDGGLVGAALPSYLSAAGYVTVPSRAVLGALSNPIVGNLQWLDEGLRAGLFRTCAGTAPSDPRQGLYVTSIVPNIYYARVWDGIHGKPEWFGATPNDGNADCLAALQACVANCSVTLLGNVDYFISATWKIQTPHKQVYGIKGRSQSTGEGTRIIVKSATADCMQVGPDSAPVDGINAFLDGVVVNGLTVTRSVVPALPAYYNGAVCGFRLQYVLNALVEEIFSVQHGTGFYYAGVVASTIIHPQALRSLNSSTAYNWFRAHMFDGGISGFGAAGGNASVYVYRADSEPGGDFLSTTLGTSDESVGMTLDGAFVDTFLFEPETVNCKKGLWIVGTGTGGANSSNIDVKVINGIFDACHERAIEIGNLQPGATITMPNVYCALTGSGPLACIHVHDGGGKVVLSGGDIHGSGVGLGLYITDHSGVAVSDLMINQCQRPIQCDNASDLKLDVEINNQGLTATQAAIRLTGCSNVVTQPSIKSDATARFPRGVELISTGNSKVEVGCSRMIAGAIIGGAGNKVVSNGTPVTATGTFGTNSLAQGIMA